MPWRCYFCNSKCLCFCFYCVTAFYSGAKRRRKTKTLMALFSPPTAGVDGVRLSVGAQDWRDGRHQAERRRHRPHRWRQECCGASICCRPSGGGKDKSVKPSLITLLTPAPSLSEPVGLRRRGPRGPASRPPSEAPGALRPVRAERSWGLTDGHAPFLLQGDGAGGCGHQPASTANLAAPDRRRHAGAQLRLGETLIS